VARNRRRHRVKFENKGDEGLFRKQKHKSHARPHSQKNRLEGTRCREERRTKSTAFKTIREQLKGFKANNTTLTHVYILQQQNGTTRFIAGLYVRPDSPKFMQVHATTPDTPSPRANNP
jgi:hypothetical protein